MTQKDLDLLREFPRRIAQARTKVDRLRDQLGLHSPSWDGLPRGSGPHDKIGTVVPMIADAEAELHQLEKEFKLARNQVEDWILSLDDDDPKASFVFALRYLDGCHWAEVAAAISSAEGRDFSESAVKKYCRRFLASLTHGKGDEKHGLPGR